jgi:hypothetical protein
VLTVEAPGFKKFSSGTFTLTVQQQATINSRLEVGELSETLEVSAAAAMVNTTIANLGQVIDNLTIVSLPNLGRNPMAFTYLTPGVVGSGRRPGDSNTNFVANGSRNSTSDVLLDGVTVVTVEQNSGITDLKYSPIEIGRLNLPISQSHYFVTSLKCRGKSARARARGVSQQNAAAASRSMSTGAPIPMHSQASPRFLDFAGIRVSTVSLASRFPAPLPGCDMSSICRSGTTSTPPIARAHRLSGSRGLTCCSAKPCGGRRVGIA